MSKLHVEQLAIAELQPYPKNPRTHSAKHVRQIADSIRTFGWTNPILIDDADGVIAGHGRLEAAKFLGMETVPTLRLSRMSDEQKRAYILADNKLAENAGWDDDLLRFELQSLLEMDLDFPIEVIGFETPEIDILLNAELSARQTADDIPPIEDGPPVSQPNDLWLLGEHLLFCGDALDVESYQNVLGNDLAAAVFTDPPYNVPIPGHVSGMGAIQHDDFAMASGEMSQSEFIAFLSRVCRHLTTFSHDGSMHFICMDWRHAFELLTAGKDAYSDLKNICIWNKTNGGMGSLYRSKHELVFVFKNGQAPHINNVALGKFGRSRTNVWDYPGVNTFGKGRLEDLSNHPTVKPVAMIADAIMDVTNRGDLVLDPFSGSGSTILAAEQVGRRAAAIELDPKYIDVAIKRFEKETGIQAVHARYERSFQDVALDREFDRCVLGV